MNDGGLQAEVASGAHKQRTEDRLALGGFAILLVAGGTLTALLLGTGPAMVAVAVILLATAVLLALYKGLEALEAWLKRG